VTLPVKPWVAALEPYAPGKPIEELERELGISNAAKLASNENPLGPSPRAVAAIRAAAAEVHRYPDGTSFRLRHALAAKLGVRPESLVFGCGGDEILELVAKCFLGPGDECVDAWPSFAMYPIVVRGMGAEPVAVPLDAELRHDLDAMRAAVTPKTRVVIVCNPNNPTGTGLPRADFERFVAALPEGVVLLIDEAYVDFSERGDRIDGLACVAGRPGTMSLRTFSKISGLAGLRVGYAVADRELAGLLERARHPFNLNLLAEVAALAALDDREHLEKTLSNNRDGLRYLRRELATLGIETWPSEANFLLARPGPSAYQQLLHQGLIVRPLAGFGMPDHVRITVGLPDQNERLVKALAKLHEGAR
jgi:histidinol-phosphate aminotransferase